MLQRTLMLMRHGKSDWADPQTWDFDRQLKPRGEADARTMARWMQTNNLVPDRVVTSTAVRAATTAAIVVDALQFPSAEVIEDGRIYDAGRDDLLTVIAECAGTAERLLMIGHNPGLEFLALTLSDEPPAPGENGKMMPTAALAILQHDTDWDALGDGRCTSARIVRPKELAGG